VDGVQGGLHFGEHGVCGGDGVVAGLDMDSAAAAGGLEGPLDAPTGGVLEPTGHGQPTPSNPATNCSPDTATIPTVAGIDWTAAHTTFAYTSLSPPPTPTMCSQVTPRSSSTTSVGRLRV